MYAIVKTGGKQYKVAPGDIIEVEKLDAEEGKKVALEAICIVDGKKIEADPAKAAKTKVEAVVLDQFKGEKQLVFKFKKRKNYKKLRGHRQNLTRVQISAIGTEKADIKAAPKASVKKAAPAKSDEKAKAAVVPAEKPATKAPAEKPVEKPTEKKPSAKKEASAEKETAAKKPAEKKAPAKAAAKKPAAEKDADKPAAKKAADKPAAKKTEKSSDAEEK